MPVHSIVQGIISNSDWFRTILSTQHTPVITHSKYKWTKISSLEIDIFDLKMMVTSGVVPSAKQSAQKG